MPGLCVVCGGVGCRWTEMQCFPVFNGNFTPSGHMVKVTSGHKVAKMDAFKFVVRIYFIFIYLFEGRLILKKHERIKRTCSKFRMDRRLKPSFSPISSWSLLKMNFFKFSEHLWLKGKQDGRRVQLLLENTKMAAVQSFFAHVVVKFGLRPKYFKYTSSIRQALLIGKSISLKLEY